MTDTFTSDRKLLALSGMTVCGLALASWDEFVVAGVWGVIGLSLVYLAGGVPVAVNAVKSLWRDHIIDIDFLMILAAIAAAAVGAALTLPPLLKKSVEAEISQRTNVRPCVPTVSYGPCS